MSTRLALLDIESAYMKNCNKLYNNKLLFYYPPIDNPTLEQFTFGSLTKLLCRSTFCQTNIEKPDPKNKVEKKPMQHTN